MPQPPMPPPPYEPLQPANEINAKALASPATSCETRVKESFTSNPFGHPEAENF
jgi:hypothetical protein